jgi:hypothetical protein
VLRPVAEREDELAGGHVRAGLAAHAWRVLGRDVVEREQVRLEGAVRGAPHKGLHLAIVHSLTL